MKTVGLAASISFVAAVALAAACGPPPAPVKNAAGETVEAFSYEERFALDPDAKSHPFRASRLERAVALLDKHGLMGVDATYEHKAVDTASVTLVTTVNGKEKKITVKNCAHEKVCAFFAEAASSELVERTPQVCKSGKPCDKQ